MSQDTNNLPDGRGDEPNLYLFGRQMRSGGLALLCVVVVLTGLTLINAMSAVNRCGWLPRSDMKNLAAMVVATEHPEAFANDPIFSNPDTFRFYIPAYLHALRTFYRLTGGFDFFLKLFSAIVFPIHIVGFYLLGKTIFRNRWLALALAVLSVCHVRMPNSTYIGWRGFQYMLPRTFFLALAPYPFILALRFKDSFRAWLAAMALIGLLGYVHPVSAPVMAAGLWCVHLLYHPQWWSFKKRILAALLLGVVFLVVIAPYGLRYHANVQLGGELPDQMTRQAATELINYRVANAFDVSGALKNATKAWTSFPLLLISILAAAGAALGIFNRETRRVTLACLLWVFGIWVASFAVPLLDRMLSELTGTLPSQISLVRGMRYFAVPVFLLALLVPKAAVELSARLRRPVAKTALRFIACLAVIVGVLWFAVARPPKDIRRYASRTVSQFRLLPQAEPEYVALGKALDAVRDKTPSGSLFISDDEEAAAAIRSVALRPLAHCRKDGGLLVYTDLVALKSWVARDRIWKKAGALYQPGVTSIVPLLKVAEALGAEYLLTRKHWRLDFCKDGRKAPEPLLEIIYQNIHWRVVKLKVKS